MPDEEVKDKWHLNYFMYMLHGIGILLPWNLFMNASMYFMFYKLKGLSYANIYINVVTFVAQVPNISFNWINIFAPIKGDMSKRIGFALIINISLFIVVIFLSMLDTSSWPGGFFVVTMILVFFLNAATGIYQNTIYGMAAMLPFQFTQVCLLGNNLSGVFTTVIKMIFDQITDNSRIAACYFFLTAILVQLLCFLSYFAAPLNGYYRYHNIQQLKAKKQQSSDPTKQKIPYLLIIKSVWIHLYNVAFCFFITLSIFPAIQLKVASQSNHMPPNIFIDITCFLTFNVMATLGSLIPRFFIWPKPKYLWIATTSRVIFLPFFILCNYQEPNSERTLPVIFGDYVYWLGSAVLAFTNGYWTTVSMIYIAITADPQYAGKAGQFGAACLISGIFLGICFAFLWPVVLVRALPPK